jgi:iron complex transport system permease protein
MVLLSLMIGAGEVGPAQVVDYLLGSNDPDARFVVNELRLPRTIVGIMVGAALGVAGTILQTVTRNPLAEPGLLGVSAGASFAVVIAIAAGASVATLSVYVAIIGALGGCLFALAVARLNGVGDDPVRMVLAGAALSSLLGAMTSLILLVDERTADEIRFWTVGAIAGRDLSDVAHVLPVLAVGLIVVVVIARPLAALALGENVAQSLGHRPRVPRIGALVAVAIFVGAATAVAGPIAFVGLVVPFAARALVGPDVRRALVMSVLLGPSVVLLADVVSRVLVRPSELPLGVMTALIGAPVLVAVVRARRLPTL